MSTFSIRIAGIYDNFWPDLFLYIRFPNVDTLNNNTKLIFVHFVQILSFYPPGTKNSPGCYSHFNCLQYMYVQHTKPLVSCVPLPTHIHLTEPEASKNNWMIFFSLVGPIHRPQCEPANENFLFWPHFSDFTQISNYFEICGHRKIILFSYATRKFSLANLYNTVAIIANLFARVHCTHSLCNYISDNYWLFFMNDKF